MSDVQTSLAALQQTVQAISDATVIPRQVLDDKQQAATAAADRADDAETGALAAKLASELARDQSQTAAQQVATAPSYLAFAFAKEKGLDIVPALGFVAFPGSDHSDWSTQRAGTAATQINGKGLIVPATANKLRDHFDLTTGAYKGKLFEGAATNILPRSTLAGAVAGTPGSAPTGWNSDFSDGSLSLPSSIFGNADGSVAIKAEVAASGRQVYRQTLSVAENTTYTLSVYLENYSGNARESFCVLVAGAGTITGTTSFTPAAADIGKRRSITFTTGAGVTGINVRLGVGGFGNTSGAASVTLSRPQLEVGSVASSYIPTTSAAVTRPADVVTRPWTGNEKEGTVYLDFIVPPAGDNRALWRVDDGTNSNRMWLYTNASNTPFFLISASGVSASIFGSAITPGSRAKIVAKWSADGVAMSVNGAAVQSISAAIPASLTTERLGLSVSSTNALQSSIFDFYPFPRALSDAQLVALSTLPGA